MKQIDGRNLPKAPGLPPQTAAAARGLPASLDSRANESILLHGTSDGVLLNIIRGGMNERFAGSSAGTAFGEGTCEFASPRPSQPHHAPR